jgi:hypothetical protein
MSNEDQSTIRRAPKAQPSFTGFRRYGRKAIEAQIIVQDSEGWEIPLDCVNISPTGMFIESPYLFDVGDEHVLIFRTPRDSRWVRVRARVVRVEEGQPDEEARPVRPEEQPAGMAYEFVTTDEDTWEHLCEFVAP